MRSSSLPFHALLRCKQAKYPNECEGVVTGLGSTGAVRRHIIDMGITPGAVIVMRKTAPMGDPIEINVRGYELSIRKSEAQNIRVEVSE